MGRKRAVICFETEEQFESVADAARAIGAETTLVSGAVKRHGACRGFHFYYAEEEKPDRSVFSRKTSKNSRPIICFETGERFKSQKEAAERLGISHLSINASLRRNMAANGFHFYYADDPRLLDADFRPKTRNKRVRCIETGAVYQSIRQAEIQTGIRHGAISCAVSGMAGGYHWEYADD